MYIRAAGLEVEEPFIEMILVFKGVRWSVRTDRLEETHFILIILLAFILQED